MTPSPLPPEIWEQTPPTAQEMILRHAAELAPLRGEVAQLKATVDELARRVARHSRHSSQPPSTDPPQAQSPRVRREASGRRPGGQPGHEGQTRALVPVEAVDVVIPRTPVWCTHGHHLWRGADPQPERHQVTEIPPVRPVITAYPWHQVVCPACGAATRAGWPVGMPTGGFGPRVQAITALCTGAYHLSTRTTQTLLADLCGVSIGLGTVANLEPATVQALAEPVAEARAVVQAQPAAYLDETGWRAGRQRAWRWTMVTTWVTVFVVRRSRRAKVAQARLGARFWGWLVTERWRAYTDGGKDSGQKLTDVSCRRAAGLCHPSQAAATIRTRSPSSTSHPQYGHKGVY